MAPAYLSDLIEIKSAPRNTKSQSEVVLNIPRYRRATLAARSFAVAGPKLWNNLPSDIRNIHNIEAFKTSLKTLFFKEAYNLL